MKEVFGEILETKTLIIFQLLPFLYFRHCKHCKCNISESISVRGKELLTADRAQ